MLLRVLQDACSCLEVAQPVSTLPWSLMELLAVGRLAEPAQLRSDCVDGPQCA